MVSRTPEELQNAATKLEELGQIVAALAPFAPVPFAAYGGVLAIALELVGAAIGTIEPESQADIEQAEKLNPLGMG